MDIKQLRYFRAIVDAGGLSKAARLLNITPSALSKAMRKLEWDAGAKPFYRAGRGLVLSVYGRNLYRESERLLDEHQRMLKRLDASEAAGDRTLRIASFEVFTSHALGALTDLLPDGTSLTVLDVPVAAISSAVMNHSADLGFTYAVLPSPELHFEKLAKIEFAIYARRGSFRDTPFDELPFAIPVLPLEPSPSNLLGIDSWPYERVPRRIGYRLTSLASALELTRCGRCAVFLPAFIATLHNRTVKRGAQLVRKPNPRRLGSVYQTAYAIVRADERRNPELTAAIGAMTRVLQS